MKLEEVRLKNDYKLPDHPSQLFKSEMFDLSLEAGIVRIQKRETPNGPAGVISLVPFGNTIRCVQLEEKPKKEAKAA